MNFKVTATLLALSSAVLLLPSAALASTAAGTIITNTATAAYNDAGGNAQTGVSANVAVTVTLVPSAPTITSPANQTIEQGNPATLTYTLTSNANGGDTYNLTLPTNTATNISAETPGTGTFTSTPVTLGGTTLAATTVAGTTITVPCDGTSTVNGTTNNFNPGDNIVIGGTTYIIAAGAGSINRAACAGLNPNITITLTTSVTAGTAANSIISGSKTFTWAFTSTGQVQGANTSGSYTIAVKAAENTSPNPSATQATSTVITVDRPILVMTKQVSTDGTTWVASSSQPPATPLFYRIYVQNTGTSNAYGVNFSDVVPQYLAYTASSGKFATGASLVNYAAGTALTDAADGDGYTYTAGTTTVAYNPGGATGTVAANNYLILFFKAQIN